MIVPGIHDRLRQISFRRIDPARHIRAGFNEKIVQQKLRVGEEWDEEAYVSLKVRDPDGYQVELYWEPRT